MKVQRLSTDPTGASHAIFTDNGELIAKIHRGEHGKTASEFAHLFSLAPQGLELVQKTVIAQIDAETLDGMAGGDDVLNIELNYGEAVHFLNTFDPAPIVEEGDFPYEVQLKITQDGKESKASRLITASNGGSAWGIACNVARFWTGEEGDPIVDSDNPTWSCNYDTVIVEILAVNALVIAESRPVAYTYSYTD